MDNWLSDLGTMKKNPAGYVYFNVGCILAGVSTLFLVSGMDAWQVKDNKRLFEAGRAFGVFSAFTLMLIGAFDENTPYHTMLSLTFFLMLGLFLAAHKYFALEAPGVYEMDRLLRHRCGRN